MNKTNRDNNFDIMRLIAAWLILYSHCFPLYGKISNPAEGLIKYDSATNIALTIFFVISGYLITESYLYRKNLKLFVASRALRILPGLIVVIFISAFALGPIVTKYSLSQYLLNVDTYKYLRGMLIFPLKYHLPGVFENNPYQGAVNGSLWTLEIELKCYILVAILGVFSLLKNRILLSLTLFCFALFFTLDYYSDNFSKYIFIFKYGNLYHGSRWFLSFLLGTSLYAFGKKIPYNTKTFLIVLIADLILWYLHPLGQYVHIVLLSYIVVYIGLYTKPLRTPFKGTDISYGVYIYAFPVQQTYMHYIGNKYGFFSFILVSTITSFLLGYFSWKLVEKPSLTLKNKLKRNPKELEL